MAVCSNIETRNGASVSFPNGEKKPFCRCLTSTYIMTTASFRSVSPNLSTMIEKWPAHNERLKALTHYDE